MENLNKSKIRLGAIAGICSAIVLVGLSTYFYMNRKSGYEKLLEKYPDAFVPFDDLDRDDREYTDEEESGYYLTIGERNINQLLDFLYSDSIRLTFLQKEIS
ncbi:hypothetical protein EHO61_10130 [Leptospira fluminis]|uniref:Uncharacterized protein n=1 Tax=Leptospira fluminis TaxID=2484979 RepID=A0A4R9GND5_9LEPT|nr:hypothetical protein [Leptospira fluminis]TGK17828.1 hypothetical protein EHO61_10130 [Leptospira fluminis]